MEKVIITKEMGKVLAIALSLSAHARRLHQNKAEFGKRTKEEVEHCSRMMFDAFKYHQFPENFTMFILTCVDDKMDARFEAEREEYEHMRNTIVTMLADMKYLVDDEKIFQPTDKSADILKELKTLPDRITVPIMCRLVLDEDDFTTIYKFMTA